jgi:hypothetical protein
MRMAQWWNDIDRGKPKGSEKNLSQCHYPTCIDKGEDIGNRICDMQAG